MSYFKAKMHQIQFRLGEFTVLPKPLVGFKGPASKGKGGREGERKQRGGERRKGREGEERECEELSPVQPPVS